MTLAMRRAWAARYSWSIVAFFCRRQSRRASIATSRPILLRYLKQSTTVRAGSVTRTVTFWRMCSSTPAVRAGEPDDVQRRVIQPGQPGFRADGQPDLEGRLRGEAMEPTG